MRSRIVVITGLIAAVVSVSAESSTQRVLSANQQIAAAVLPLPEILRGKATVIGYSPDLSIVTLRQGSNGMVCSVFQPGTDQFDMRCYHESFMPLIRRLRELHAKNLKDEDVDRIIDEEVKTKKLVLPDHPTAGYRMYGPLSDYQPSTNLAGKEIHAWQSIHFPYKTAAEIGLAEEGQVPRTMPYVMTSGTFWSHVMIEHEDNDAKDKK
ncbi:MAG TPA: hypothetical protein VH437_05385 [Terriglobales bacterium]